MSDHDDPGPSESRRKLRGGKEPEIEPVIKKKPWLKKQAAKHTTRSATTLWLLGEPKSLKFWTDQTDTAGNILPAFPDMTGKQLPSLMEVMGHMAYLRQSNPKGPVYDLAIETCDTVCIYWRMAKIPVQELSSSKSKTYCAAYRLSQLWQEYQTLKNHRNRKSETDIQNRADMSFRLSMMFSMEHPNSKKMIMVDSSRQDIDKEMDIEFLEDQKFERKMVMGK